ncbi:GTPase [Winogradskyella aurantia]|uniref:GTPase n=1 Tax=Winogradskyella aurantia TaxID=1915063 RepID=A0A265UPV6_9FLAO|nr:GTPase [Winogradskyella aurantia]OZV67252.1 GTPase [Winogradskyella aurantia]
MKLIFIYNADSGVLNSVFDTAHKLLSPQTYACSLCALTYGPFGEKNIWKNFRKHQKTEMIFYHKDEFEAQFPNGNINYPAILKLNNNLLSTVLDYKAISKMSTVEELIKELKSIL